MGNIKDDMKLIQELTHEAYLCSGRIMALLDGGSLSRLAPALEGMCAQFEESAVTLRNLCERNYCGISERFPKPEAPWNEAAGTIELTGYGWMHIKLNTLLPHCRYRAAEYLTDTIRRLMDEYENGGLRLPRFEHALLVIDERCDIENRNAYDQDNKGWKAVPNALKGRLISDDDQFTLGICLVASESNTPTCHIYLMDIRDAGKFFCFRDGGKPP